MEGIIYLALCALVAWFADSRGRNPFLCFLWSVCFTPFIVFIVYVLMGRKAVCSLCEQPLRPVNGYIAHCSKCHSDYFNTDKA